MARIVDRGSAKRYGVAAWALAAFAGGLVSAGRVAVWAEDPPLRFPVVGGVAVGGPLLELGGFELEGAETLAYDATTNMLAVTCAGGVGLAHLGDGRDPRLVRTVDIAGEIGLVGGDATHVAVDPAGRGVAAVSVTPRLRAREQGRVAFVSLRTGRVVGSVLVGFTPDSLAFTEDGGAIVVANEGEPEALESGGVIDPAGSVSVIDLRGVGDEAGFAAVSIERVETIGFDGASLDEALRDRSQALRIHPRLRHNAALDLEPEYVAIRDGRAFVTLQENNAIGEFDIAARRWVRVTGLGSRLRLMDASDRDGGAMISQRVEALPMPDQLALFTSGGRLYAVTADEGDTRMERDASGGPLADHGRAGELASYGLIDARAGDLRDAGLGRLKVCAFTGDVDGDGLIDAPTALGARSVSVYDVEAMSLTGDTGDQLERAVLGAAPAWFNANAETEPDADSRSDDRGPEPEGVVVGVVNGVRIAFVSIERPGGVAMVNVSSVGSPRVMHAEITAARGDLAAEGLLFLDAQASPSGEPMLLVAYEVSGTVRAYRPVVGRLD